MAGRVSGLISKFEKRNRVVITGHGAWHPTFGTTVVPQGITLSFYVPDTVALNNSAGQNVDGFNTGQPPLEVVNGGANVKNYKLYPAKGAKGVQIGAHYYDFHYLALGTHPKFDSNCVVTTDLNGVLLSTILGRPLCRNADVHWSCCRSELA
jgi:hypothetical protein